ncbi:hypothetical protein ACTQ3M_03830 [Oscillospiraceae bacterium LCP25S3_E10]|nr:hypothetical protein [Ruminococcus sp.]MDD6446996.1 hypothetical protein [Ruminococcus sp.]MDY2857211.1 hypothetical protein [Oscillospiraceae bacterium]
MKTALIYYTAHKTGYCETALRGAVLPQGVDIDGIVAAVSPQNFGDSINNCLNKYDTLFVIGDTSRNDRAGIMPVLSCGLNEKNVKAGKLQAGGNTGYLLELDNKKIVVLPDQPEAITALASAQLIEYLKTEK